MVERVHSGRQMVSSQNARRAVWRPLWELPRRIDLIVSLTRRELAARYKGSALGIVWAVLTPEVMIAIFTIIFAGNDDRDLHNHLCRDLQSEVWRKHFSMG